MCEFETRFSRILRRCLLYADEMYWQGMGLGYLLDSLSRFITQSMFYPFATKTILHVYHITMH
jgi:hypothetical protein